MADLSPNTLAVLHEIAQALSELKQSGAGHTLFVSKMPLSQQDRNDLESVLGMGALTVRFEEDTEPVEWKESSIAGVWYGTFYNQQGSPLLETLEIALFPVLAQAQPEDIEQGQQQLLSFLENQLNGGSTC